MCDFPQEVAFIWNWLSSSFESGQPHIDLANAPQRWTTEQLGREFTVHGFMAPFVVVTRKADGVKGSMTFTNMPRFYFDFTPD